MALNLYMLYIKLIYKKTGETKGKKVYSFAVREKSIAFNTFIIKEQIIKII